MPRNERRRQQSLAKKAAKRKQKKHALVRQAGPATPRTALRAAAHWPLYECLLNTNWQDEGALVQILVARSSPEGAIAAASFLVDLGSLGVKDALVEIGTVGEYEVLRRTITSLQPMATADLNLVARILREGVEYARGLGFKPNRDYADAAILLGDADPDASGVHVPLGVDGKPYYMQGPHDNVPKILAQLERAVGPGNFEFVAALPGFAALDDEEAWDDEVWDEE